MILIARLEQICEGTYIEDYAREPMRDYEEARKHLERENNGWVNVESAGNPAHKLPHTPCAKQLEEAEGSQNSEALGPLYRHVRHIHNKVDRDRADKIHDEGGSAHSRTRVISPRTFEAQGVRDITHLT